ncbi:hypothetical protein I3F58_03535 [Streptomyces sp. MUM 203J]|uniref:DUF3303 family protein n=1 Tax=Streptomyces sp. MUM 203J TaxID=2791990 RepID=UPI001F04ED71|nr:DUF3303 family protein [Streptomyces sp. MUM 203J]MCH0538646.1 hypothetical protein [Streptomyces sp. MUM 203J]
MRMMLRATMDTGTANDMIKAGQVQGEMKKVLDQMKPEAVYFTADRGKRACTIVFDMDDSSRIPVVCEPLFQSFGAEITVQPCMNLEDLQRGLAALAG